MMIVRSLLLATALLASASAAAQNRMERAPANQSESLGSLKAPVLRATVAVTGELVRIGDVIENAGPASQIPIYRAPDLGTTGSLPIASVLSALRAHQVIGVDTGDIRDVSVTRLARTVQAKQIEQEVAHALERRGGLGDAGNLTLTFDRELQTLQLDASNSGELQPTNAKFDSRSGRFDVAFEIANDNAGAPMRLRFTGSAVETVEAAVLTRNVERNEVLKASDVVTERRPKAEVGADAASRETAVGMQARRQLRAGQSVRVADLAKPDLVSRDQSVTLIYESAGLYLTVRGKAVESGTEGDVVNVLNLQSKRTVSGTVTGRGQVSVSVATPRVVTAAAAPEASPSIAPKTE